ncbi:TonB-dependent receptor [Phenylobacterium sp.]|uniref:TonB-dependent receptor n=1 Tax=Phenylobacterium sp. TaxID=1871053 RepID=UPI002DF55FC1|nr:TonB-dependent receptor [Phenylobacterium sp.]
MKKHAYLAGASGLAVAASLFAVQAHAADAPAGNAAAATTLEDLVVTAERRAERLETVPVAVTAFSADQRSLIGIESIQDLTNFTPGLHYNSIANRPYLRGVGRNTDNLAVASAVAVYYNGVYDGANATTILQHSDLFIDTIEVDRGPQNTLHGANSDGGTINYVSKRPTKDYYAEGRAGVANYDKWFGEAVVSGPITDNLRFRLGGNYTDESGGFFKNLDGARQGGTGPQGNSGRTQYWEAQLDANLGEHLDAWGMVSSGLYETNYHTVAERGAIPTNFQLNGSFSPSSFFGLCGIAGVAAANPGCATGPAVVSVTPAGPFTANMFPGNNPTTADPRTFIQSAPSTNKQRADISLATNWTYHAPGVDLTYLAGFQKFNYQLNFTGALDAGLSTYSVAGAPAAGGLCALNAAAEGLTTAGCTQPLAINPSPNWTHFVEMDQFFSHEFDLVSTTGGPFQWILGAYYYHEKYEQPVWAGVMPNQTQLQHPFSIGAGGTLIPTPANPASAISTSDTFLTYTSYAAFGQASYKFSDEWKVTGGLRYSKDKKNGRQLWRFEEFDVIPGFTSTSFGANTPALDVTGSAVGANATTAFQGAGLAVLNPATGNYERALGDSWSAVTGDADIDWTPDHDTLVYAKYSRGYKAGGFSTFTIAANPETQKETVDAYEVGLKKTIAAKFQVNAAAFYYNYKNDQIPLAVQNAQGLIATSLFNLKSVHITGFELEGVWRPIDPLTISFQYSHLSAKVNDAGACIEDTNDPLAVEPGANTGGCTQTSPTAKVQNLKGNQLPEAPPNKFSANALYSWDLGPGTLTLSGTYVWKDKTYGSLFNRFYSLAPSYNQEDFRLSFKDAKDRYTVIAFVQNAFNHTGYDNQTGSLLLSPTAAGNTTGQLAINQSLIAPRIYGLQVQVRFK